MSLTSLTFNPSFSFLLTQPNGFSTSSSGNISNGFNLNGLNLSTWPGCQAVSTTIAPSTSQTINMNTYTDLLNNSVTASAMLTLFMTVTGAAISMFPSVSNGIVWSLGSGTITIPAGGFLAYSWGIAGAGDTIGISAKNITLTNSATSSATVSLFNVNN